ncbi:MAG: aminomethyltransferase [Alphaproteobacteria bacterium]|nr:aminomethyltransferase [Alphaproteobacteria bacterium]
MGARAAALRKELLAGLAAASDVVHMTGAVANGLYDDGWLAVIRGNRLYKVRAKAVVVATGAMEQPAVFRNNDRPGVMLGTAAQRLIRLYGVRPGRRAVVLAGNDDAYGVALDLAAAGVEVAAVIDLNGLGRGALAEGARDAGLPVLAGHTVAEVIDAPGSHEVVAVRAAPLAGRGRWQGGGRTIDCDLVCMSVGYVPAAQLLSHAGADVGYDDSAATFVVGALPVGVFAAGSVAGHYDLDAVLADGRCAGWAAARHAGFAAGAEPTPPSRPNFTPNHPWPIFPHPRGREFVDFDEDLQVADLRAAVGDGFAHIELLKRYSTLGMGPSQGRHSALPGVLLTADATGTAAHGIRRTTVRPPYTAEKFGVLAGRGFEPVRVTAMHQRHLAAGAKMMPAGPWLRPAHYPSRPGDHGPTPAEAAIRGEALSVRNGVGIIDVSTLGGLDVRGPDAAEFLERMYTFAYAKQPVGRGRYVLMTDLAGVIVDDGVACRFGEHHFYVTATTSGAQAVYQEMLWYNAQWRLQVDVTNVTAAYCGVNIAGPGARRVLQRLADDIDLSPNAFPYMGVRQGTVAGVFARVLRVGFVGELGYEIHVLAPYGEALWDALMIAGATEGIRPFGVEAQRLLRLEKGHIIIGQDTDGSTHPYEADMAWAIARKKPFFVGQRSVAIQAAQPLMRKLVGFVLADRAAPVPKECHLVIRDGEITGRVTSCAHSPSLEQIIGLAYVAPDQAVAGGTFAIKVEGGRMVEARVVALPFYDPEGKRQEL